MTPQLPRRYHWFCSSIKQVFALLHVNVAVSGAAGAWVEVWVLDQALVYKLPWVSASVSHMVRFRSSIATIRTHYGNRVVTRNFRQRCSRLSYLYSQTNSP